jgi:hypothetical protein
MESQGVIYYIAAPGIEFSPKLLENFNRAIQFKELDLPIAEGEIEQATLEGKYLVTRAGKWVWTTIIINQKPTRFTREAIHSFTIKFENRWGREIKHLYTKFKGDISIFKQDSMTRESVDSVIDEVFHLSLTLPHKLGFPTGKKIGSKCTKIWQLAEDLAHKTRGKILLGNLFSEAKKALQYDNKDITDCIWELIQINYLMPIPLDKL